MNLYVYLKGGLGNQMFQYAAGLSALKEYSQFTNLKLDTSFYIGQERKIIVDGLTGRGYDLDLFNLKYDELEVAPEGSLILDGFYQNISEFENVIDGVKEQFTFKNKFNENILKLSEQINQREDTVCIHVLNKGYAEGLNEVGIDKLTKKTVIRVDPKYFRPAEVETLLGDASKAKEKLGWEPKTSFKQLVEDMCVYGQ